MLTFLKMLRLPTRRLSTGQHRPAKMLPMFSQIKTPYDIPFVDSMDCATGRQVGIHGRLIPTIYHDDYVRRSIDEIIHLSGVSGVPPKTIAINNFKIDRLLLHLVIAAMKCYLRPSAVCRENLDMLMDAINTSGNRNAISTKMQELYNSLEKFLQLYYISNVNLVMMNQFYEDFERITRFLQYKNFTKRQAFDSAEYILFDIYHRSTIIKLMVPKIIEQIKIIFGPKGYLLPHYPLAQRHSYEFLGGIAVGKSVRAQTLLLSCDENLGFLSADVSVSLLMGMHYRDYEYLSCQLHIDEATSIKNVIDYILASMIASGQAPNYIIERIITDPQLAREMVAGGGKLTTKIFLHSNPETTAVHRAYERASHNMRYLNAQLILQTHRDVANALLSTTKHSNDNMIEIYRDGLRAYLKPF